MFVRYAVFYTPPKGPFADQCAAWLGWDNIHGRAVAHPNGMGLDVGTLTQTPRKYGFHATLKAPFHLAHGQTAQGLQDATASLAARLQPVTLASLSLQMHHGFVALRPTGAVGALRTLAARIVRDLDPFRAPPTAEELARRRKAPLTPRQDTNLRQWGYPYVMDDFNFHMTLSGQVDAMTGQAIIAAVGPLLKPLVPRPFVIDAITLLGQSSDGFFHQIHRYALTG